MITRAIKEDDFSKLMSFLAFSLKTYLLNSIREWVGDEEISNFLQVMGVRLGWCPSSNSLNVWVMDVDVSSLA